MHRAAYLAAWRTRRPSCFAAAASWSSAAAAPSRGRLRPASGRRTACSAAADARTLRCQGVAGDLGSNLHSLKHEGRQTGGHFLATSPTSGGLCCRSLDGCSPTACVAQSCQAADDHQAASQTGCPAPVSALLLVEQGRMLRAGHQKHVGVEGATRGAGARQVKGVWAALQAASQGRTPPPALPAPACGTTSPLLLLPAVPCCCFVSSSSNVR